MRHSKHSEPFFSSLLAWADLSKATFAFQVLWVERYLAEPVETISPLFLLSSGDFSHRAKPPHC
jgi:hypothetical protein